MLLLKIMIITFSSFGSTYRGEEFVKTFVGSSD